MTLRTLAAPAALAVLLSLWGCAGTFGTSKPAGQDSLAAGNAAFEQKDYARACQELSKAGGGAETLYRTGYACARDGEAKADRAYKAALAADAQYAAAMEALGLAAFAEGDLGRAGDLLEASAKAGGTSSQAALVLGETYLLSGRCEPALAAFQEALRREPGFVTAKARFDVARGLCGPRRGAQGSGAAPSGAAGHGGGSGLSGTSGGMSGATPAAGAKEAPKGKPASKTIDLNDI
jgi:tetratricopeptide (TPR) repeat protein